MSWNAGGTKPSTQEVNDFHTNSDVDKSEKAQHHTIGYGPNQAAPGWVVKKLEETVADLTTLVNKINARLPNAYGHVKAADTNVRLDEATGHNHMTSSQREFTAGDILLITISLQCNQLPGSSYQMMTQMRINGALQAESRLTHHPNAANSQHMSTKVWSYVVPSTGNYEFELKSWLPNGPAPVGEGYTIKADISNYVVTKIGSTVPV